MNVPATFKQVDVKRAVKAVSDAGLPIGGVEITKDGTIRVITTAEQKLEKGPEPDL